MPTLADIYSAINTAKRKASDVVSNPMSSLGQMVGYANDRARTHNELLSEASQEPITGPKTMQLANQLAEGYNPAGMVGKSLTAKYPNIAIDVGENPTALNLSRIVVPPEMRNQGLGSNVMKDLIQYADENNKQINLSPSADFGGSPTRLKKFYSRFGFKENRGKNRDFSTSETMVRTPVEIEQEEYKSSHTAPNAEKYGAFLHDLTQIMPKDVYTSKGKNLYGVRDSTIDHEWWMTAMKAKGKPDAEVTVYRAVPKGVKNINNGDWVTTSKKYAEDHGENSLNGEYQILSKTVKAKHLSTAGDPQEYGYNEK